MYLRLELGPLYLELGRLDADAEPEDEEPDDKPALFAHNDQPLTAAAYGPGFRVIGPEHFVTEEA